MRRWYLSTRARLGLALVAASLVSLLLFGLGAWRNQSLLWNYFVWNLFLAWVPLVFMVWLERLLRRSRWSGWLPLVVTVVLIGFLPNAFYLTTDLIHLQEATRVDLVYDVVMVSSFIFNAFTLGLLTVYLLHTELRKRVKPRTSWLLVSGVLFVTSFAIYIGRDLRWNTWDILFNPGGVLFDVSDRLLNAGAHPDMFLVTLAFFLFLTSVYVVVWGAVRALRSAERSLL